MGIIRAITQAIGGGLADQWLEVYEADDMGDNTVFTSGVLIRKGQNRKGTPDTVSNGSVIHVYDNQFMMLVDGGKVVDYTAEPGYYKVDNSSMPSMFNGELGEAVKETFSRIKFGGQTPTMQKVFFINLQEIKGIKFGTRNPINYFDNFYNAELFLRAHGTYSIKVTNPLQCRKGTGNLRRIQAASLTFSPIRATILLYQTDYGGTYHANLSSRHGTHRRFDLQIHQSRHIPCRLWL